MRDAVRPGTVHDLGKLMLAFTMLWAYVNLSQFLIIWSGNIAEETPFYLASLPRRLAVRGHLPPRSSTSCSRSSSCCRAT